MVVVVAILLSVIAIIEAVWSPRFQTIYYQEHAEFWLFYNSRKKADRMVRRKGFQLL